MKLHVCAAEDCKQPFEPVQEYQKFCSVRCANRVRVRLHRARKRFGGDGGDGPGGGTRLLFSRSELHRRKPAKSALKAKPKQDGLFPEDGIHATQAIGYGYDQNGNLSDVLVIGRKSRNSPPRVSSTSEAPLAA